MQRLILAQIAAMTIVLATGGSFVLKLFDMCTPCTASFYFVLHKLFDTVMVLKPNTSRPASSERYLVCKGFHQSRPEAATQQLLSALRESAPASASADNVDVRAVVSKQTMWADTTFMQHLKALNVQLGERQLLACEALLEWARVEQGA